MSAVSPSKTFALDFQIYRNGPKWALVMFEIAAMRFSQSADKGTPADSSRGSITARCDKRLPEEGNRPDLDALGEQISDRLHSIPFYVLLVRGN